MGKKSKKNKIDDLLDVGDGKGDLEVDGGLVKEKGLMERKQKKKSKLNEVGDEIQHNKCNLEADGDLRKKDKKKRKRDLAAGNLPCTDEAQIKEKDRGLEIDVGCAIKTGQKQTENKKKSKDKARHKKANLKGDGSFLEGKKKRKRDDAEDDHPSMKKAQIEENDSQVDGPQFDQEPGKKKRKHEVRRNKLRNKEDYEGETSEKVDKKRSTKKKKKKKEKDSHLDAEVCGVVTEESVKGGSTLQDEDLVDGGSKTQSALKTGGSKGQKKKKTKSVENNSEKPKEKGNSKTVRFNDHVEVFPPSDINTKKQNPKKDNLVRGKRFTPEEDEILKEAVLNYIKVHDLGEEGLKKVMNCSSHREVKKCWKEIGECIPYRPKEAIYYRAHTLFERAEKRAWTPEEIEFLQESYKKHGNKWKMMAEVLGKHRVHVKDTWRRIRLGTQKRGHWNQEEYQSLYDLVNLNLQMKIASQNKKSKHGMLRDNIPWGAISDKLATRTDASCCLKWYNQLTSSLVAENKWTDADDYHLIGALYDLDATCVEDVDWDDLLEHRPGDICRKRWDQMVHHIGHHGSKPFSEQVDILADRYCPDLAEIREAWDKKPIVP